MRKSILGRGNGEGGSPEAVPVCRSDSRGLEPGNLVSCSCSLDPTGSETPLPGSSPLLPLTPWQLHITHSLTLGELPALVPAVPHHPKYRSPSSKSGFDAPSFRKPSLIFSGRA